MAVNTASVERVVASVLGSLSTSGLTEPTMEMTIQDDLGIDSVTFMFAILQVQEQLGLDFFSGGAKAASVRTVGDFVAACLACAAAGDPSGTGLGAGSAG